LYVKLVITIKKAKFPQQQAMKTPRGSRGVALLFLLSRR